MKTKKTNLKKKAYHTILFILLSAMAHTTQAQNGEWNAQTSPTTNTFNDVFFLNEDIGWIAANGGIVLYTSDGGDTWVIKTVDKNPVLSPEAIIFINAKKGWVCGSFGGNGFIAHTTDVGDSWQVQLSDTIPNLYGIQFTDESNGWAVGDSGVVLHTNDGGTTWNRQAIAPSNYYIKDLFFLDADTGWVAGGAKHGQDGVIFKTINGGKTWTAQTKGSGSHGGGKNSFLNSIFFVDNSYGWAVGTDSRDSYQSRIILRTKDGGNTWNSSTLSNGGIYDIYFTDTIFGWSVGFTPGIRRIWRTIDGGNIWKEQSYPDDKQYKQMHSIWMLNPDLGWAVGQDGTILKYTDSTALAIEFIPNSNTTIQFYPNPSSTMIVGEIYLNEAQYVKLQILDALGKHVSTLTNEKLNIGINKFQFNMPSDLSDGMYIYRLEVNKKVITGKLMFKK